MKKVMDNDIDKKIALIERYLALKLDQWGNLAKALQGIDKETIKVIEQKIMQEYHSLEGIWEHLLDIKKGRYKI